MENKKVMRWDCRVLIQPATDLPGQWVAHCLQGDVVSQGDSPIDARDSLFEAFQLVFEHELQNGRNPFERRQAPKEYWDTWNHVMQHGRLERFSEMEQGIAPKCIATMMTVVVEVIDHRQELVESDQATEIPPAWVIAAPRSSAPMHV